MSLIHDCPHCGKRLKLAKPVADGVRVKCPQCTNVFAVRAKGADLSASNPVRPKVAPRKDRPRVRSAAVQ
ncbi:MAG: hypothetical protein K2X38_04235 [Gemmataceae bacterium]|nr:hypothetical protein [Gemmataceae bacterium]